MFLIGGACLVLFSPAFSSERLPQTVFYFGRMAPVSPALDEDGDGMSDAFEQAHGLNAQDPLDAAFDLDGDGLSNLAESTRDTNPWLIDSDGDGVSDSDELGKGLDLGSNTDTDFDGLSDDWERFYFGSLDTDGLSDADGDGVSNADEFAQGSHPGVVELTDTLNVAGLRVTRPGS